MVCVRNRYNTEGTNVVSNLKSPPILLSGWCQGFLFVCLFIIQARHQLENLLSNVKGESVLMEEKLQVGRHSNHVNIALGPVLMFLR